MKKILYVTLILSLTVLSVFMLSACNKKDVETTQIKYDGFELSWEEVENASKYDVYVDEHLATSTSSTSYQFFDKSLTSFNVRVVAIYSGNFFRKARALGEFSASFQKIDTIDSNDISISNTGELSWDAVEGALGYRIKSNGEDTVDVSNPIYAAPEGNNTVFVKAICDETSTYSYYGDYPISALKLATPQNVYYDGTFITWSSVMDAHSYNVSVNNEKLSGVIGCSVAYDAHNSDFSVNVTAIGNHSLTFDSVQSETKSFVFLDQVRNLSIEDGILSWDNVEGADGYNLRINNGVYPLTTNTYANVPSNVSLDVSVLPTSNDSVYFSSYCNSLQFTLLNKPLLEWADDFATATQEDMSNISWNPVQNAVGYVAEVECPDGSVFESNPISNSGSLCYAYNYASIGQYIVRIKAIADSVDGVYRTSAYSEPIYVNRLAAPTPIANDYLVSNKSNQSLGFNVYYNAVAGAKGYKLLLSRGEALNSYLEETSGTQFTVNEFDKAGSPEAGWSYSYSIVSLGTSSKEQNNVVFLDSLDKMQFSITILPTPTTQTIEGTMYKWGSVLGNFGYNLKVSGVNYSSTTNSADLNGMLTAGDYAVNVCAQGNGTNVLASAYTSDISIYRLKKPTNITIDPMNSNGTITCSYDTSYFGKSFKVYLSASSQGEEYNTATNYAKDIPTTGTFVSMMHISEEPYVAGVKYIMSSERSDQMKFIKLAPIAKSSFIFTNTQFKWNAPGNINPNAYTPSYIVYKDANKDNAYFSASATSTQMDISTFLAGTHTFYVAAYGGVASNVVYVNSDISEGASITKLETPSLTNTASAYTWNDVALATSYVLNISGIKACLVNRKSDGNNSYSFNPSEHLINPGATYAVSLIALGDGGLTTIDSSPYTINQKVYKLSRPVYTLSYSDEMVNVSGRITLSITTESPNASGYAYSLGGSTVVSAETQYSFPVGVAGDYITKVSAVGKCFDENKNYWIDSSDVGGNENFTLHLLSPVANITRTGDLLAWTMVNNAISYEYRYRFDDGDWTNVFTTNTGATSFSITNLSAMTDTTITVQVRCKGADNSVTSEWYEKSILIL